MTMRLGEASLQARVALAEALRSKGIIRSRAVFEAFIAIPREAFVPVFFENRVTAGNAVRRLTFQRRIGKRPSIQTIHWS